MEQHLIDPVTRSLHRPICEAFQLSDLLESLPGELSGGQQQRLAIARAFVQNKPLVLMDEPLSQIDSHLREQMRTTLSSLHQNQKTIFICNTRSTGRIAIGNQNRSSRSRQTASSGNAGTTLYQTGSSTRRGIGGSTYNPMLFSRTNSASIPPERSGEMG